MSSNKRENIGQIPKAGSIGEVQKADCGNQLGTPRTPLKS